MTDMSAEPCRVLVRPWYPQFLENRLFSYDHPFSQRWYEPYIRWREVAHQNGFQLDTWDQYPLESADIIFYMDLPEYKRDIQRVRAQCPHAKLVVMIVESPLSRPHMHYRDNLDLFDWVLTFNWRHCDEKKYFRYYLPIGAAPQPENPPFDQRRPLIMINTNRSLGYLGLLAFRQPGLIGLPSVGTLFRDWHVGLSGFWRQAHGELYSYRRKLARLADAKYPNLLDIYGIGWNGESTGWIHRLRKPKPFSSYRGQTWDKDSLLPRYRFAISFENMRGDVGYISEKIFDTLANGVVPIYLGDDRITDHVAPDCFVDARQFRDRRAVLEFARDCSESTWQKLRDAGQAYLHSDQIKKFQSDAFAHRLVHVLKLAAGRPV